MLLKNHIAYRFLTDDTLAMEIVEKIDPEKFYGIGKDDTISNEIMSLYHIVNLQNQKAYYITETVIDKLDMLKIKKKHTKGIGEHYDWTVFYELQNFKKTFIFPLGQNRNMLLRMLVQGDSIYFCLLSFKPKKENRDIGEAGWILFNVNKVTGEMSHNFNHIDVQKNEPFIYHLLCFIFLSDNDEIEVAPKMKYGTKKSGKIINTLNIPITIVNSRWNTTVIRKEAFGVVGHFAIRWTGIGRTKPRNVFIEPYEKKGYVRKAQNELISK